MHVRTYNIIMIQCYYSTTCIAQRIAPENIGITNGAVVQANGSAAFNSSCVETTNSCVLHDCTVPTINTSSDTWASQLLILENTTKPFVEVDLNFSEEVYVGRVEVVAFNCATFGTLCNIRVRRNNIFGQGSVIGQSNTTGLTFCDSLVRICFPLNNTLSATVLNMRIFPKKVFDRIHLAEVAFYGNSTCPQANAPINLLDCDVKTFPSVDSSSTTTTTTTTSTTNNKNSDNSNSNSNVIIIVVCVVCVVILLVVCVVVVVLLLWRCGRHHKHRNTYSITSSTHSHQHPPITLCRETGQFYAQINKGGTSHLYDQVDIKEEGELIYAQINKDIDQLYDQVDIKEEGEHIYAQIDEDTEDIDQLYDQVDMKKGGAKIFPPRSKIVSKSTPPT